MKILGTGLSGLVGSRIVELLEDSFEFESSDVDISDEEKIKEKISDSDASVVLHLAAKTDVDGCETDKDLGEKGEAWKINVLATQYIADVCQNLEKKLLYISTDFVFSGLDCPKEGYSEDDNPNPVNWYAQTKYEAEKIVLSNSQNAVVRISYPYRSHFQRPDVVRSLLANMGQNKKILVVKNRIITPTFIDDIAFTIPLIINKNASGIFHAVGSQSLTFLDGAKLIAKTFGLDSSLIEEVEASEFYKGRAKRPFQLALKNDKITQLGAKMSTFEEGLIKFKNQL